MWTEFYDLCTGGYIKTPYKRIYIEAPKEVAIGLFCKRFERVPVHMSCECCDDDYAVREDRTLEEASSYARGCDWDEERGIDINKNDPTNDWSWSGNSWYSVPYRTFQQFIEDSTPGSGSDYPIDTLVIRKEDLIAEFRKSLEGEEE